MSSSRRFLLTADVCAWWYTIGILNVILILSPGIAAGLLAAPWILPVSYRVVRHKGWVGPFCRLYSTLFLAAVALISLVTTVYYFRNYTLGMTGLIMFSLVTSFLSFRSWKHRAI